MSSQDSLLIAKYKGIKIREGDFLWRTWFFSQDARDHLPVDFTDHLCYCVSPCYCSFQIISFLYGNVHIPDILWKVVFCTIPFLQKTLHKSRHFPLSVAPSFSYYLLYHLLHLRASLNWYVISHWGNPLVFWYKHDGGWKMLKNDPIGWQCI